MKELVFKILRKALQDLKVKIPDEKLESLIELPPSQDMGDYALPCFSLSPIMKLDAHEIALQVREKIGNIEETDFSSIDVTGPYVNFFLNRKSLARQTVWDIINKKASYGSSGLGKKKKVVFEFSSPNVAKPFGIGHLRSTIIGNSLASIFEFESAKVTRLNYLGDWGTQFGRLLFGFKKFGNEKLLEKDPLKQLYSIYVKTSKKMYDEKAREWFRKMEAGDKSSLLLWKVFRDVSIAKLKKVYKQLGITFDSYEGESDYNKKAKLVLQQLDKKKLLKKSSGALVVDLEKLGLGVALMEKSDGATLYATRDLAAAIARYDKYKFDFMFYEVGQEQKLYFEQLFKILGLMGYQWSKDCFHISHGLYLDSKGKKFSTRKGKTVFLEDILEKTKTLAAKEIKKRTKKISKADLEERSLRVAIAAIFYGDLKNNRRNDVVFDLKRFVSFEGDTGPYLLYSYARASSILRKSKPQMRKFEVPELHDKELSLAKKLSQFPDAVANAYRSLNPAAIANYSSELAQSFNEFYHACPVLGSEEKETFRLALVESFRQVMKNALTLLGITTVEEM